MKQTAIIYCRKSTDREELQQNSIEHQLSNCRETVKKRDLVVLDEITENRSAKDEYKREGFNRMIEECKKGKIDYIIIDEPKRLSRNNIDSSRIIDLMDKKKIKGIYSTGREYLTEQIRDKFFLQFDLSLSKMDNEDRSKDIKDKMLTAVKKGKWMGKAIFGYRNVGTKGKKDVEIVEQEAEIVRECFLRRARQEPLQHIAEFINEKSGAKWNAERVSKMIKNKKYYGIQHFGGIEEIINTDKYKPIISKELYDKANSFKVGYEIKKREDLPKYFSGILRDEAGLNLYPYIKKKKSGKEYIYYHTGNKSKKYINISEKSIFTDLEEHIKNYVFPKPFTDLSKAVLKDYYKDKVIQRETDIRRTQKDIENAQSLLDSLLEKYLGDDIDKQTYQSKRKELEGKRDNLQEKLNSYKQGDNNIVKLIEELCELAENLYETYKSGNSEKRAKIIRAIQCELIVNTKKELTIKESKLFSIIKNFNFHIWYSQGESNSCLRRERAAS